MSDDPTRKIIEKCRIEGRTLLTEVESKQFFSEVGINVIDTRLATNREQAVAISKEIGFPVALKIISPDIVHKSDVGGVRLDLKTTEEVGKAFDNILAAITEKYSEARVHGISVQKMARPGTEVIIGMFKDHQFGPVLMFGLGGIFVEILKDVSFGIVPLTRRDAREMIREIRGYPLLEGYRGKEKVNISNLESMLLNISDFVKEHPEIQEFDLNPIIAYKDGAVVVDARLILRETILSSKSPLGSVQTLEKF